MPKNKFKGDIDVFNPLPKKGVFPDPRIPMPDSMQVKPYRKKDILKSSEIPGGDKEFHIRKTNPKPRSMYLIEKEIFFLFVLKNPRKYVKLS